MAKLMAGFMFGILVYWAVFKFTLEGRPTPNTFVRYLIALAVIGATMFCAVSF
jgi:hypothetical protein